MNIEQFNYDLPAELIAQYPLASRDQSRLLVVNRSTQRIIHTKFKNITDFFSPQDALVLNNTKVRAARIVGKIKGKAIDILLVERIKQNCYWVKAKPMAKIRKAKEIIFDSLPGVKITAKYVPHHDEQRRIMAILDFQCSFDLEQKLDLIGTMPLPPYIKRTQEQSDKTRYQTIFAKNQGAIAAPTAGLHFSKKTMSDFKKKNIEQIYVTLHVGLGTFEPVRTDNVEAHKMHAEDFEISQEAAAKIMKIKNKNGKICAVGTTVARVLESVTRVDHNTVNIVPQKSTTEIFIYPLYDFKACDMLITNFHLPKTSLLMLVCAFASRQLIFKAYEEAVREKYRFFSYGDCMLII